MSQRRPASSSLSRGFTLVELLITAAVLVVVSSVSFPAVLRFYEEQKLRQAAIELQSHLLRGRTLAQRLQTNCALAISNGTTVQVSATAGVINNACASGGLAPLNLTAEIGVLGLCISNADGGPATCSPPAGISFLPLGVLAGAPQTLYLSGTGTRTQACVDLSLTLIRVGFRNGSSGACTYSRS